MYQHVATTWTLCPLGLGAWLKSRAVDMRCARVCGFGPSASRVVSRHVRNDSRSFTVDYMHVEYERRRTLQFLSAVLFIVIAHEVRRSFDLS